MQTRYLRWLAVTFLLVLTLAGIFNLVVDPSGIWRLVERPGFNVPKARPDRDITLRKLWLAIEQRPDALILGNSRADIGFDPMNPAWKKRATNAFNLAVPGQGLEDSVPVLDAVCREYKPRLVLAGLDFVDFLSASGPSAAPTTKLPRVRPTTADRLHSLFTAEAVLESVRTLRAQRQPYPEIMTAAGFNPLLDYIGIAKDSGYYALFQQRLLENARTYSKLASKKGASAAHGESTAVAALRQLIASSAQCGNELVLVTYPYHSQLLLLFRETGLWNAFEDWKRLLVSVVEEEKQKHAAQVRLIDFAYFSQPSMEPIPAPQDRATEVHWYWEAGHFKRALGDVALDALFTPPPASDKRALTAVPLSSTSIEAWLVEVRQQEADFLRERPGDLRPVRDAVAGGSSAASASGVEVACAGKCR